MFVLGADGNIDLLLVLLLLNLKFTFVLYKNLKTQKYYLLYLIMALKFRVTPLSFPLTSNLRHHFKNTLSTDTEVTFFGYEVIFTKAKKKEYFKDDHRLVKFDAFLDRFETWLRNTAQSDLDAARRASSAGPCSEFNYARAGVYTTEGDYISSVDSYCAAYSLQVAKLPVKQKTRSLVSTPETMSVAKDKVDSTRTYTRKLPDVNMNEPDATTTSSGRRFTNTSFTAEGAVDSLRDKFKNPGSRTRNPGNARATGSQAAKMVDAAKDLEKKFDTTGYVNFRLGATQRPRDHEEVHVPVSRGNYSAVLKSIVRSNNKGFVITGPTGCGKSTVALLPLFIRKVRVLVVEPTQANAANIYHEFANILPNLFNSGVIPWFVPSVQFVAPTVMRPPYTDLQVTTTEKLLEYFEFYGKLPAVDYLIVDEFHLPIQSMVQVVELLRTFDLGPKYVFVSATAVGYAVNPQLPKAVTQIYGQLPLGQVPSRLEGSDLDPRRWFSRGDGTVGIVAPSVVVAQRLFNVYKQWGLRTFLVTRETRVSEYMKAATNHRPRSVYVLEPGVEAGVTLSLSVLVSMGAATAVRYDGKVVIEDTQPLDAIAAIQRGGRGGRVVPTLYVTPRAPEVVTSSSADYYRAQALVKLIAAGANVSTLNDRGLFQSFPRLKTVSRELAVAAVATGKDPFVALYQRDDSGRVYKECGGDGTGFSKLAESELFLYHYGRGFFVAPIADFSDLNSRPDLFVERQSQLSAAHQIAISVPGLEASYTLDGLIALLISKFDVYVNDLFQRLKSVFSEPAPTKYSISSTTRSPDVKDFLESAPEIMKLFEYMVSQPSGVVYERKEFEEGKYKQSTHSFLYGDIALHFAFPKRLMDGNAVNVKLLGKEVHELLKGILAIEMLIDGAPEKCVDLLQYTARVPKEHLWYSANVRHGQK